MLKIFGQLYYIDFEVLDDFLKIDGSDYPNGIQETKKTIEVFNETGQLVSQETITEDNIKHKEINGVKFELIRNFIEDLVSSADVGADDYDSALGSRNLKNMSLRFKLAFNTLLFYNILRTVD
jgi:hypothetical protein